MQGDIAWIELDRHPVIYLPGETLRAGCHIDKHSVSEVIAVEMSVLWFTEGKGSEDMAVHHFNRFSAIKPTSTDEPDCHIKTTLPNSPLSYEGKILRLRWCVRARLFGHDGSEQVVQQRLWLMSNRK